MLTKRVTTTNGMAIFHKRKKHGNICMVPVIAGGQEHDDLS
jgi:hypothetical protein